MEEQKNKAKRKQFICCSYVIALGVKSYSPTKIYNFPIGGGNFSPILHCFGLHPHIC